MLLTLPGNREMPIYAHHAAPPHDDCDDAAEFGSPQVTKSVSCGHLPT